MPVSTRHPRVFAVRELILVTRRDGKLDVSICTARELDLRGCA